LLTAQDLISAVLSLHTNVTVTVQINSCLTLDEIHSRAPNIAQHRHPGPTEAGRLVAAWEQLLLLLLHAESELFLCG
jgi:uncharacterized protein YmfQ (DUF2313 family)